MPSQPIPYPLRMPDDLRERLNEKAKLNNRSLHAEIIGILQGSLGQASTEHRLTDEDIDRIAARLAEKLKTK